MSDEARGKDDRTPTKEVCTAKRPYEKPTFRYEGVFETRALACGKIESTQSSCRFNRRTS
jgi:hypothetical protein